MRPAGSEVDSYNCDSTTIPEADVEAIVGAVYTKYHLWLHSFLVNRLGSRQDADDIAQEVYVRLIRHRRIETLNPSFSLLRTIASNLLKDRFRSQQARSANAHIPFDDANLRAQDASPEEILTSKEGVEMLTGVFESLNKNCQRAFVFHRFKGLTYEQIATEMNISRDMVKKHISHALKQFRKKIGALL
ncbi:MAG: RNA polymerase sigma factor [Desulfobacteraceae bacterium]|nr:RNA polymerase sigma factor [Desulfobacteraceae bacterium]